MKKALLIILLLSSSVSYSQKITIAELFSICNKGNWDEVNEYLLNKGWEYHQSSKGDDEHYNTITWSFNKEYDSEKAQGWFYLYTYQGMPNKVGYSFSNKASYNLIKSGISTAGLKLIDNSIEDNELISNYSGLTFLVTLKTSKTEIEDSYSDNRSVTMHFITVIKKAGVYDTENGLKKFYDSSGNLETEYTLKNSKINGSAKSYFPNGNTKVIATFVNGVKNGLSKEFNEDGSISAEYNYLQDSLNGSCKFYSNGKISKTGFFCNGKKCGKFVEFNDDGAKKAEYTMENDDIEGLVRVFEDNLLVKEYNIHNGQNDGILNEFVYDENHKLTLKVLGNFKDDKRNGLWATLRIVNGKVTDTLAYTSYLNDIKNGPFLEYTNSDTLESGTYKMGMLNGNFKRQIKQSFYWGGDTNNEISSFVNESEGKYNNGKKNGKWTYYILLGIKSEEGNYEDDLKTGKWIEYMTMGDHANEIWKETNYKKGKEDGISKNYFINSSYKSSDSSIAFINYPVVETFTFSNGLKNGEYTFKDSTGMLVSKGNYSSDFKSGLWLDCEYINNEVGQSIVLYKKGNYDSGKKNGVWVEYINENEIIEKQSYLNGELDGELIRFNENKKPSEVFHFTHDQLNSIDEYDSLGNKIYYKYKINFISNKVISCSLTTIENNISRTCGFQYISSMSDFNYYLFDSDFKESTSDTNNIITDNIYLINDKGWKREGVYEIIDLITNDTIKTGYFKNNKKDGQWKYFYHDVDTYMTQDYSSGYEGIEKYFSLKNNRPLSGKFELKYPNKKIKCVFKISDGLRDGKSKYYDEKGNEIAIEKYDKGILQAK